MAGRTLVISNPPHGTVETQKAAPILGLIPVDANLKMHYPIPELWVAEEDPEAAIRAAEALGEAGCSVVVAGSDALVAVPAQRLIRSFAFGPTGLSVTVGQGNTEVPYAYPVTAVYCVPQPPAGGGGASALPIDVDGKQASEDAAFLDLFLKGTAGVIRLSVYAELVDFSGLGESRVPSHARNMARFVEMVHERFTHLRLDRRLVNMQLRRRVGVGTPATLKNARRGFSFASPGLRDLLQAVAPALVDVSQSDWCSRLVYLTLR